MTTAGKANVKYVKVTNASTGLGVAGLTSSAFTLSAFAGAYGVTPAAYSVTPTVTDLANGYYSISYALGPAAGFDGLDISMVSTAYNVAPVMYSGEVETYDLTALAALIPRGQGVANAVTGLGQQLPITLPAYRYSTLVWTITGVDLTQYSNFCLGLRDTTQLAFKLDLWFSATQFTAQCTAQAGPTIVGTSDGIVTITVPRSLVGPPYIKWKASQPKKVGDCVAPLATSNGYVFCCTTAGTTSGTEPTWIATPGSTTTDGGVTWTCLNKSIWQPSTVYHYGDYVTPLAGGTPEQGGVIMRCVAPGTSAASPEPTWGTTPSNPQTNAGFITDGGVTWQVFNDVYALLAEGASSVTGVWELTGQLLTTGKMVALTPSSPITLVPRQVGT